MTSASAVIYRFLRSMGAVKDPLGGLLRDLHARPQVSEVGFTAPQLYTESDFGLSATLRTGAIVDLWVFLQMEEGRWTFSHAVHRHDPDEDGSHEERTFEERSGDSLDELPLALELAVRELRSAALDDASFR